MYIYVYLYMCMSCPSSIVHVRCGPAFEARCTCRKQDARKKRRVAFEARCTCRKQDAREKRRALQIVPPISRAQNCQNARRIHAGSAQSGSKTLRPPHREASYLRSTRKPQFFKDVLHQMTGFGNAN